jgi:Predicted restriction endonuclease
LRRIPNPDNDLLTDMCNEWIDLINEGHYRRYNTQPWRKLVLERDNYRCQICDTNNNLHAHHVKPWIKYPLDRYDVNNGLTLCDRCHWRVHSLHA